MKYRALVVEDDQQIVHLVTGALVSMGHEFDIASSQQEALAWLAKKDYSYILLDIQIRARAQDGDGRVQNTENMLESIADGSSRPAPPIILLSDYEVEGLDATVKVMRLGMSLGRKGAWDIIRKPFPTAGRTLDRVIKKVLRIQAAMQRHQQSPSDRPVTSAESTAAENDEDQWLTVSQAAELLMQDCPSLDLPKARSRVSTAASRSEFRFSGARRDRRIDPVSFDAWRLKQRDRDLDQEDAADEEAA